MGGESATRETKNEGRIEDITNEDPEKKVAAKKDQRKNKKDNGYALAV